ncbi:MAG: bifunctional glutamate N-acetyltransferase/amino-acid acetyltransferase ArgJ [Polyangiaceae bacterium]
MRIPKGFSFAATNAGIKAHKKDMALVASELPCSAAGVLTVNRAKAPPVEHAEKRLPGKGISAIVLNSGNANALTGDAGREDVKAIHAAMALALGIPQDAVLSMSTGVIGVRLPVQKLVTACDALAKSRGEGIVGAAEAIMTTDTRVKLTHRMLTIKGTTVTIAAFAKGSGMVAPEMATVLGVITTDAAIEPERLQAMLVRTTDKSFHSLVIDNDMSTNDAVFMLANGASGVKVEDPADVAAFEEALTSLTVELARAVAEDGEGATKLLEVRVGGAPTAEIARDLARMVAGSNLVKAAIFGADPNWGRVLAAIGSRIGSKKYDVDPNLSRVSLQGEIVFDDGGPKLSEPGKLRAKMREPQVKIDVDLRAGSSEATVWGCDLSYDYVKINADYISFTNASPEGVVTKDDRLTNYSPSFKRSLLVEALSYIDKFSKKRAVVKYGGAAMVKDSLKASFANDINLLCSAGLLPIVVHGGGPEISRTLEKLGQGKSEFVDGVRVTGVEDVKVVEMVLTGRINTEIVSLLNQKSAKAVGVSGKDAGLLRARRLYGKEGRDLGMVGEITQVNRDYIEMLLEKGYVPVVSPVGLGEDGEGYNINADTAAAEIACALSAEKLIYLSDVPGILDSGELISEITASELRRRIDDKIIVGGMAAKAESILRALAGGVSSVHVIDGRTPHGLIAELFTDRGIGTLVRKD